jgi:hypothetical protein
MSSPDDTPSIGEMLAEILDLLTGLGILLLPLIILAIPGLILLLPLLVLPIPLAILAAPYLLIRALRRRRRIVPRTAPLRGSRHTVASATASEHAR